MSKIIDGRKIANEIKNSAKFEVEKLRKKGIELSLAVVTVGENKASQIYVANKKKSCLEVGINFKHVKLNEAISQEELIEEIKKLNEDFLINGIIVQLPLPAKFNSNLVLNSINPKKDVDCLTNSNISKIYNFDYDFNLNFLPCTPHGILKLINSTKTKIEGKHCVVVGRSRIVGKPLALILLKLGATVTICHSKTYNLSEISKQADILISAVGQPNLIKGNFVKKGAIAIDVGISRIEGKKIVGDFNFEEVACVAEFLTPVPGGVGPMTVAMLIENVVKAAKLQNRI